MAYRAVLIANWTYDEENGLPPLDGPEADLELLEKALTDEAYGLFDPADIVTLRNQSFATIRQELGDFLAAADKDDFLFIYFSGHGIPVRDNLVLCTAETKRDNPLAAGLEVSYINNCLPDSRSETTMVVLDCCYAGRAKGAGTGIIDLGFAQNLYLLASCGAYEVTPDAKNKGEASPFTAALVDLMLDDEIPSDDTGRVSVDTIWERLGNVQPTPVRSASGRGSHFIARRGEVRDAGDRQALDPLVWLPEEPMVHTVDLRVGADGFSATWPGGSAAKPALTPTLRGVVTNMVELIDGVGNLSEDEEGWWDRVTDGAWRGLGNLLLEAALPDEVRTWLGEVLNQRNLGDVVRIRVRMDDHALGGCPWEALGPGVGAAALTDYLALTEGVVVERDCEPERYASKAPRDKDLPYGIYSPSLSEIEVETMSQVASELKARSPALTGGLSGANLIGSNCTWESLLSTPPPRRLVLGMPLRSDENGKVWVGFSSSRDASVQWRAGADVVNQLRRWDRRLDCVVVETVARPPARNAVRATIDFSRLLARAGLGPVAYLCHPPGFRGYPRDLNSVPVTFAGELLLALMKSSSLQMAVAVHHARTTLLLVEPSLTRHLGFPGFYTQESRASAGERPPSKRVDSASSGRATPQVKPRPTGNPDDE